MSRAAALMTGFVAWALTMAWVLLLPVYPNYGDGDCGTSALGAAFGRGYPGCTGPAWRLIGVWGAATAVVVTAVVVVSRTVSRVLRRVVGRRAR